MKRILVIFLFFLSLFSCKEDVPLTFNEEQTTLNEASIIEITIPIAEGATNAFNINETIEHHIASSINFSEDYSETVVLDQAIAKFNSEYTAFKNDFKENALVWEALFDGEVIYRSEEIITIAITSYLNTGGAHGNSNITLFNFDPETGNLLKLEDIISNMTEFTEAAKQHFYEEVGIEDDDDYFFGEDFHLPANIGYNDEGVLLLYNVYEIASYAHGITEFTIPFSELGSVLNVN